MIFDWHYALSLLADKAFWSASWRVVELSIATWVIGIVAGFLLALGKQSRIAPLRVACSAYIWLFRSLPLLVLLIFVYNLPQVFPVSSMVLADPFRAGLIALSISEAAYIAEIHRGGLLSIGRGQFEAGQRARDCASSGCSGWWWCRRRFASPCPRSSTNTSRSSSSLRSCP